MAAFKGENWATTDAHTRRIVTAPKRPRSAYQQTAQEWAVYFTRADPDGICERPICAGMSKPLDISGVLTNVAMMSYTEVPSFELDASTWTAVTEMQTRDQIASTNIFSNYRNTADTALFDPDDPCLGDTAAHCYSFVDSYYRNCIN